jgi:uncharacterized protein
MPPANTIGRVVDPLTEHAISVTGTGEATYAADVATVSLAVSARGKDLAALREDVSRRASAVLAALRELGIAEPDFNAPDLTLQPEYDYRHGQRLTGYRAARQLGVRVRDLERLGNVLDATLAAGADEVHGVQMAAADPSAAEHAALAKAVAAARAKAEVLAQAAGISLSGVARIEEEQAFDAPMPMFRAAAIETAADAPTEVVAGPLTVTRRVRVWFAIG